MANWLKLGPKPLLFPPRRTISLLHGSCQNPQAECNHLIIKKLKYSGLTKLAPLPREMPAIFAFLQDYPANLAG